MWAPLRPEQVEKVQCAMTSDEPTRGRGGFSAPLDWLEHSLKIRPAEGWKYRLMLATASGLLLFDDFDALDKFPAIVQAMMRDVAAWQRDRGL